MRQFMGQSQRIGNVACLGTQADSGRPRNYNINDSFNKLWFSLSLRQFVSFRLVECHNRTGPE
jgi:hypothetical protein